MKSKMGQFSVNLNPIFSVSRDGTVLYSNEASEPLLQEWGAEIGEKLPSSIVDLVQSVISRNSPEKIEVKVENKLYLVVFSPLPEQELVSISGFDISGHRELGEETQESEERLKALMDHNPSLVFLKDECGRYVYLNKSYEEQFIHSKDWYGKTDFDFWPKESAELFRANDTLVLKSGHTHQFIEDSTDLNGTRYCWLNYKFPFTDSKNRKYVGGIGIDITGRVRAEEALQESERVHAFQSAILESVRDPLWATDSGLRIVYWNDAAAATFGWTADEIHGRHTGELFRTLVPGSTRDEAVAQLMQTGDYRGEVVCHCKDGRPILVEASSRVVRGLDGKVIRVVNTARDITARKRIEKALRESENLFRTLFECTDDAFQIVELIFENGKVSDFRYLQTNAAFENQSGLKSSEVAGKTVKEILPNVEPHWFEMYGRVIKEGRPLRDVSYNQDTNRWYDMFYFPYGEGKVGVLFRDMTDKKRAEEALQEAKEHLEVRVEERTADLEHMNIHLRKEIAERKKTEEALKKVHDTLEEKVKERTEELKIAYNSLKKIETIRKKEIHHRIKNNLQVISSLLDLQAEKFNNKECIKNSEVLEAFKESQNRVISMALIHEELHRGGEIDSLNFSQYIVELVDNLFFTYRFGSEGIILDTDIEESIFFDMDTSIPLGIIINELVSNSLKHAFTGREKGEIKVKLHREESKECIESISEDCKNTNFALTISDNGVGIPEGLDIEDLDSLGFQLVISLVDQMDGEFELKRNNGTEFTMKFSVIEKDNQASTTAPKLIE